MKIKSVWRWTLCQKAWTAAVFHPLVSIEFCAFELYAMSRTIAHCRTLSHTAVAHYRTLSHTMLHPSTFVLTTQHPLCCPHTDSAVRSIPSIINSFIASIDPGEAKNDTVINIKTNQVAVTSFVAPAAVQSSPGDDARASSPPSPVQGGWLGTWLEAYTHLSTDNTTTTSSSSTHTGVSAFLDTPIRLKMQPSSSSFSAPSPSSSHTPWFSAFPTRTTVVQYSAERNPYRPSRKHSYDIIAININAAYLDKYYAGGHGRLLGGDQDSLHNPSMNVTFEVTSRKWKSVNNNETVRGTHFRQRTEVYTAVDGCEVPINTTSVVKVGDAHKCNETE